MKHRVNIVCAVNAANVSRDGDTYTVRDVVHAIDGIVLNGRMYPGDELQKAVAGLEGRPAPAGHPKDEKGRHISAANGKALAAAWIGAYCVNSRYEGGRALCDITINAAQAKAMEPGRELLARLDAALDGTNSEPICVSSGLFLREIAANGEGLGGKKYRAIASDMSFDHLAILLNEAPAGTPEEGIGMFVNSDGTEAPVEQVLLIANAADTEAAEKKLRDAIELHQAHMDGKEPTTGAEGDKSQMRMMKMMKAALAALVGKGGDKGKGMAMNVATVPADRRGEGWAGWLQKLIGNGSDLSFDQIHSLLRGALPDGAWPVEVYARHLVWVDQGNKLWRQDYAISSDSLSVSLQGEPVEVVRRVDYQPVTTNAQEKDEVKDKIVAALNAAGISTEGKDDAALLVAYNALVSEGASKPLREQLTAANAKVATFEANAKAEAEKERDALAAKLAVNSALSVDDYKAMPLDVLKKIDASGKGAAAVLVGNAGQGGKASEFAAYDFNAINGIKE